MENIPEATMLIISVWEYNIFFNQQVAACEKPFMFFFSSFISNVCHQAFQMDFQVFFYSLLIYIHMLHWIEKFLAFFFRTFGGRIHKKWTYCRLRKKKKRKKRENTEAHWKHDTCFSPLLNMYCVLFTVVHCISIYEWIFILKKKAWDAWKENTLSSPQIWPTVGVENEYGRCSSHFFP